MSGEDSDKDSKQFDPTPRRLEKAREEGDAVRSEDIQAALSGLGFLVAAAVFGAAAIRHAGETAMLFFDRADSLPVPGEHGAGVFLAGAAVSMAVPTVLLLLLPMALILIWLIANGPGLWSLDFVLFLPRL